MMSWYEYKLLMGLPWVVLVAGGIALLVRRHRSPKSAAVALLGVAVLLPAAVYLALLRGYLPVWAGPVYNAAVGFTSPLGLILLAVAVMTDRPSGRADNG